MEEVNSFHFDIDMKMKATAEGFTIEIPINMVGDFQNPDRVRATLSIRFFGLGIDIKTVVIGDIIYIQNSETQEWEVAPSEEQLPFADLGQITGVDPLDIQELTFIREETLDDIRVYHLKGKARPGVEGPFGKAEGELQVEYWTEVESFLLRKASVEGEVAFDFAGELFAGADIGATVKMIMTMSFSDFDVPVDIQPPEAALPSQASSEPAPTPPPTLTEESALDSLLDTVLQRVSAIRNLQPIYQVVPQFITREELAARLVEDLEEEREEIAKDQELLIVLGLIPPDTDLFQLYLDLLTEQVAGFFDTETEELYVVQDVAEITPLQEITLAHEYVHALQQQHFDIHTMIEKVKEHSDVASALAALIEGGATAAAVQYLIEHLALQQQRQVLQGAQENPVLDASPYFIQKSLLFPYESGVEFILAIQQSGQWADINSAYDDPPASTEQILHPKKYLAGEQPIAVFLPNVAETLGETWSQIDTDVMGEFALKTYMETLTSVGFAANAAAGWGGDRFTLLKGPQEERALALLTIWDSTKDALEFLNVMSSSPDSSKRKSVSLKGNQVLLILAPSEPLVARIRDQFSGF